MEILSKTLEVGIKGKAYPIHLGSSLGLKVRSVIQKILDSGRKVCVVTDENLKVSQASFINQCFDGCSICVLPAGETTKSMHYLGKTFDFFCDQGLGRNSVLIAFGGGVIGDLTGYAAASYLRGIDFYQVPTTLLSMVDSSVGGKTGINISGGKNLVGAFYQPEAVFIDTDLLSTLPPREFSAGMAEVVKTGLLGNKELFDKLVLMGKLSDKHPDLVSVITACCVLKSTVVSEDEREMAHSGGRALLNLGHTFGHAIENVTGYGAYLHGEAVAIGLVMAKNLSIRCGYSLEGLTESLVNLLQLYQLPLSLKEPLPLESLMKSMFSDKKTRNGKLRFVLLRNIGDAITKEGIDEKMIEEIWRAGGAK